MEIPVHIRVGEGCHELALVLLFEGEGLIAGEGISAALVSGALVDLDLLLDFSKVVVALAGLLLLFSGGHWLGGTCSRELLLLGSS